MEKYPWHDAQWAQLRERLAQKRLPHGLLLTGPAGVGKRAFAAAFGQSLLCRSLRDDGLACGTCDACLLVAAGTHPDYMVVGPEEDKTHILIDQVRELCRALGLKSHAGGYKIAVVAPAEQLNASAANGLLKTLEEPTDNSVLILVTERPARLPATVRSRCQQLRFPAPPAGLAADWLKARTSAAEVDLLLRLAEGSPLRALELAQDEIVARRRDWLRQLVGLRQGKESPVVIAAEWSSDPLVRPLYWSGSFLTDLIRLQTGQAEHLINKDLEDHLKAMNKSFTAPDLHHLLDQAWQGHRLASQSSVNRQLLLEAFLIQWSRAGHRPRARA